MLKFAVDGVRITKNCLQGIVPTRAKRDACCEAAEPCWMPHSLGEITCELKAGDKGTVCLLITNEDFRARTFHVSATGKSAGFVTFSQKDFTLTSKERVAVTAEFLMPKPDEAEQKKDCSCIEHEAILWVRGCQSQYLRWTLGSACESARCCHEVTVHDCPDYTLHWYDHFHILRPCVGSVGDK